MNVPRMSVNAFIRVMIGLLVLVFAIVACNPNRMQSMEILQTPSLTGRLLLWHTWEDNAAEALEAIISRFRDIYPEVTIISVAMPASEIERAFVRNSLYGFGPDVLLASNEIVEPLRNAHLLHNLQDFGVDASSFVAAARQALSYDGDLFGIPITLDTYALYYNRDSIARPASDVTTLLEHAQDHTVALESSFFGAMWGIRAFGGELFDDQGRVVLDQGGFAEWLTWLRDAQDAPEMLMSPNEPPLFELFASGNAAYFIGSAQRLPALREALGERLGVTTLPRGPEGSAGPFLRTEALLFNRASSATQTELALRFAQFVSNREQQRRLMRELERVPANAQVRIDARLRPAVFALRNQARTAVPYSGSAVSRLLVNEGRDIYIQVLEGILSPEEAADMLSARANQAR